MIRDSHEAQADAFRRPSRRFTLFYRAHLTPSMGRGEVSNKNGGRPVHLARRGHRLALLGPWLAALAIGDRVFSASGTPWGGMTLSVRLPVDRRFYPRRQGADDLRSGRRSHGVCGHGIQQQHEDPPGRPRPLPPRSRDAPGCPPPITDGLKLTTGRNGSREPAQRTKFPRCVISDDTCLFQHSPQSSFAGIETSRFCPSEPSSVKDGSPDRLGSQESV
ncbi:hypothetical protein VUR80DRAFT_317 [Thermomyces stellatus]